MIRKILGPIMMTLTAVFGTALIPTTATAQSISADEARTIAKEAYIYGFPLVDRSINSA
jgi:hypothetical protein